MQMLVSLRHSLSGGERVFVKYPSQDLPAMSTNVLTSVTIANEQNSYMCGLCSAPVML